MTHESQVFVGLISPLRLLGARRVIRPIGGVGPAFVALGRARRAEEGLPGECQKLDAICRIDG